MMDLQEALLPRKPYRRSSLSASLYLSTFLKTLAFAVAILAVWPRQIYELMLAAGSDSASAAFNIGVISALRHLSEFVGSQLLASWLETVGCRTILLISNSAVMMECALMVLSSSPIGQGAVHVVLGLASSPGPIDDHCIVASMKNTEQRNTARGKVMMVLSAALLVGPLVGGTLATMHGSVASLITGNLLGCAAVGAVLLGVPADLSGTWMSKNKVQSHKDISVSGTTCQDKVSPKYAWFCGATVISGMGMAAFGATCVLWMGVGLSWNGMAIGRFLALGMLSRTSAQAFLLPLVAQVAHGREHYAAQACLCITALRFFLLAGSSDGGWAYIVVMATSLGFCSTSLLSDLCARHAPRGRPDFWSAQLAALNTAASAVGAVIGSRLLASAFRGSLSLGAPLLFAASCEFLACACIAQGLKDTTCKKFPEEVCSESVPMPPKSTAKSEVHPALTCQSHENMV
mmetsp:Transcript_174126/g.423608  ORF Transcript_174126/g.423608 Transcript_174126/m.423608 type:complete len:461 (-) Transcript_174126:114-1496(-)